MADKGEEQRSGKERRTPRVSRREEQLRVERREEQGRRQTNSGPLGRGGEPTRAWRRRFARS